jgi:DNA-binding GntR family transcriptional regulator
MAAGSLSRKAYTHIQEHILSGKLPVGAVISEAELAKTLGVSRTPVGEAIRQLAREGLVEQVPRFGTIVRSLDRRELEEMYEMRDALESFAAARAAERITPPGAARLRQFCEIMRRIGEEMASSGARELSEPCLKRFLAADLAFHLAIIEASQNRRMVEIVKEMRTVSSIFRMRRVQHDVQTVHAAHEFHARIVAAIVARDGRSAAREMSEHIRAGEKQTLEQFDRETAAGRALSRMELPPELLRDLDEVARGGQFDDIGEMASPILADA